MHHGPGTDTPKWNAGIIKLKQQGLFIKTAFWSNTTFCLIQNVFETSYLVLNRGSFLLSASLSLTRRGGGWIAMWHRVAVPVVSERHGVSRRLDRTQLRHHPVRQHPVCRAHRLPVHHHGGMDRDALLREFARPTWRRPDCSLNPVDMRSLMLTRPL